MFARFILTLHKLQYPIPGFFTFGLWVATFLSFLMGNSAIGWYLLYFLMLKIFVQISFMYIVAKKMATQASPEEIKAYTSHIRMKFDKDTGGGMASFEEMMKKQAEAMQQKANQNNSKSATNQTIGRANKEEDYIDYEEIEEEKGLYTSLQVGDVIRINDGTSDPDFPELDLSGYHARVKNLYQEDGLSLVDFAWDSLSIEAMPLKYFKIAHENEFNLFEMTLAVSEVSKATARDTLQDVEKMNHKIIRLLKDDE